MSVSAYLLLIRWSCLIQYHLSYIANSKIQRPRGLRFATVSFLRSIQYVWHVAKIVMQRFCHLELKVAVYVWKRGRVREREKVWEREEEAGLGSVGVREYGAAPAACRKNNELLWGAGLPSLAGTVPVHAWRNAPRMANVSRLRRRPGLGRAGPRRVRPSLPTAAA